MADDAGRLNEVLAETTFLYGGNAAFVEDLHASWAADPNSVDAVAGAPSSTSCRTAPRTMTGRRRRRAWARAAPAPRPDWRSAHRRHAGRAVDAKAVGKIAGPAPAAACGRRRGPPPLDPPACPARIMMIRAYRMRGHLQATLDPLGIARTPGDARRAGPRTYGFTEADMDRPIFLDCVLGLETATLREILDDPASAPTAATSACSTCTSPSRPRRPGCSSASRAPTRRSPSPTRASVAILKKLIEAEAFERFLHKRFPGTKRFGLDGGEAMVPALEQIIKRGGAAAASTRSSWACRTAAA